MYIWLRQAEIGKKRARQGLVVVLSRVNEDSFNLVCFNGLFPGRKRHSPLIVLADSGN